MEVGRPIGCRFSHDGVASRLLRVGFVPGARGFVWKEAMSLAVAAKGLGDPDPLQARPVASGSLGKVSQSP